MNAFSCQTSEILRLKSNIAADNFLLKLMRLAPPNTYPHIQFRQIELGRDFDQSRLRVLEDIARKFDPDQPRVPAGNPDGGQWTDGGVGRGLGATAGPKLGPVAPAIKPAPSLKPGPRLGAGPLAGAEALRQLLQSDPLNSSFKGNVDEAVERYNWLLEHKPRNVVPALHFTPHEFQSEQGPKLKVVVVPLLREQVEGACPLYGAVQTQANLAVRAAGKVSDYRSPADFGTRAHTIMKENILHNYSGRLIPERSYLKYFEELEGDERYSKDGVRYGLAGSLRLDVLENVGNGVICVYDLKTGKTGLTPARMHEISQSVHRNFGDTYRIIVIPIQPRLDS